MELSAANDDERAETAANIRSNVGNMRSSTFIGRTVLLNELQAVNDAESKSNILVQAIVVKNTDHAPFISNLVMRDTVIVPPVGDTTFFKITVTVSDSDGLQDITSLSLTSRRPDNSVVGVYPMYDDGGLTVVNPFGLKSGDATAGDGIYTLTIPLLSSTTGNTYRNFSFSATDRSGESSNILTKNIFIQ